MLPIVTTAMEAEVVDAVSAVGFAHRALWMGAVQPGRRPDWAGASIKASARPYEACDGRKAAESVASAKVVAR